jgi:hypothetical protein
MSTQEKSFYLGRVGVIPYLQANLVKKANDLSNHVSVTVYTTSGCSPWNRCSVDNVPKFVFMHNCNETVQKVVALTQTHEIRLLWFGLCTIFAGQNIWQTHFPLRHHCQCQSQSSESRAPYAVSQGTLNLLLSAFVLYVFTENTNYFLTLH